MKQHLILATMVAIVFVAGMAHGEEKQTKTIISDNTLVNLMSGAYDGCMSVDNNTVKNKRALCSCVASTITMNAILVIQNHKLRFEDDMLSYSAELAISGSQITTCNSKGNN